jgi:hypothetical protein
MGCPPPWPAAKGGAAGADQAGASSDAGGCSSPNGRAGACLAGGAIRRCCVGAFLPHWRVRVSLAGAICTRSCIAVVVYRSLGRSTCTFIFSTAISSRGGFGCDRGAGEEPRVFPLNRGSSAVRIATLVAIVLTALLTYSRPAEARHHAHHHRHFHHASVRGGGGDAGGMDARPAAWCGWYMRRVLGVVSRAFNVAAHWAHWGHSSGPVVGAVVVWPHHVGRIVGACRDHRCLIESGNDGHRVRTRMRSIAGVIAIRAS